MVPDYGGRTHGELGEAHRRPTGYVAHVVIEHTQRAGAERVKVDLAVVLGGLAWRARREERVAECGARPTQSATAG
jgi:hypothetical protein